MGLNLVMPCCTLLQANGSWEFRTWHTSSITFRSISVHFAPNGRNSTNYGRETLDIDIDIDIY
jgi:hypothetical protein